MPPEAQDLVPVGLTKGMMREAMKGMGVPRQAIDAPGQRPGDSAHLEIGRTTTAVP
jgi:hypothetical protein